MFRKVSCWPAKLASGKSSAVADERTATSTLLLYCLHNCLYALVIFSVNSFGNSAVLINSLTFFPLSARLFTSEVSKSDKICFISCCKNDSSIKNLYAWAVTENPFGILTPCFVKF